MMIDTLQILFFLAYEILRYFLRDFTTRLLMLSASNAHEHDLLSVV